MPDIKTRETDRTLKIRDGADSRYRCSCGMGSWEKDGSENSKKMSREVCIYRIFRGNAE